VVTGHYFNPLKGVKATDSLSGADITSYLNVYGSVNYGVAGTYALTYKANYGSSTFSKIRTITVGSGTYEAPKRTKVYSTASSRSIGNGSVRTGTATDIEHVKYSPSYIAGDLLDKPLPTNNWWGTLISENYGGGQYYSGGNGIYTNYLRNALCTQGLEVTNDGEGFIQYMQTPNGEHTASNHCPFYQDMFIKPTALSSSYQTQVIDYSDNAVKVACRNGGETTEDQMVVTMAQGSPFTLVESLTKNLQMNFRSAGVTGAYNYYDLQGNLITQNTAYTGQSVLLEVAGDHVAYASTGLWNAAIGGAVYQNIYFLFTASKNTTYTPVHGTHASPIMNDQLNIKLGDDNYMTVTSVRGDPSASNTLTPALAEANYFAKRAAHMTLASTTSFKVDHASSVVTTNFRNNVQYLDNDDSTGLLLGLMPHQYKKSDAKLTSYYHKGFKGTIKVMEGNSFSTKLSYAGMLPSFTKPSDSGYSATTMTSYLQSLDDHNVIVESPNYDNDTNDYINKSAPYWNSKAIYPLSQGLVIADQIGASDYKASFIKKLEYVLSDWFTYDTSKPVRDKDSNHAGDRYFYYDDTWGTLYFSDGAFNTAGELSDHHFTHGYLVYAAGILAMYDPSFYAKYKDIIDFETNDYACADKNSNEFPYLRCFDTWAGHSWANGLGYFTEGNNEESSSEGLNAWVGAYLVGLADQDQERIDAAIYGFTTEMYSVKQYWFDYDGDVWLKEAHTAGIGVMTIQWAGKNDYATWFGANPSFIYGIEWLPVGEYLTSYALGSSEVSKLQSIYGLWKTAQNACTVDKAVWAANFRSVQAIFDPSSAISEFSADAILNDDYPSELSGAYWMVHALKAMGTHSADTYISNANVGGSVYQSGSSYTAEIWNPSGSAQSVTISRNGSVIKTVSVAAHSFVASTF